MSIDATKPVFRVSDKIIPKQAFSATETRQNSEISVGASFNMILFNIKVNSKDADQTARMRKLVCAFVVRRPRWQNSSRTFVNLE